MFDEISLYHWRQFNQINIALHERMTVLTGQNGTGKTTILNILSKHFGWNLRFISTPLSTSKKRSKRIWSDVWDSFLSDTSPPPGAHDVGKIKYKDGGECRLMAPPHVAQAQYDLTYQNQKTVLGLHIPDHRPSFSYHRIHNIPVDPKTSQQHYQAYQGILQEFFLSDRSQNPGIMLKQSLIALAVFGYGNQAVVENSEYKKMFEEFQNILNILLPKSLGFKHLEIRMPDIVFVTESGDFSLDAASGGVGALVGIAWQVFMYGQDNTDFVVTIDEPESHLHPSMQRELLPNLFRAFPQTQFIVATHSPFIVTSAPEARVYALIYNESQRVNSCLLEKAELSGTANEVLREILGVSMTVPIWVENRFNDIIEKYKDRELTMELLRQLKAELIENNLVAYLPEAINKVGGEYA